MRKNGAKDPQREEALQGNRTKIDPKQNITGAFVTNAVTRYNQNKKGPPTVKDNDAELARNFAQENKK